MKQRNGYIALWKYIFAIVIVFFHCRALFPNWGIPVFYLGYLGVEFYFIVAGYYLAKKTLEIKKNPDKIGEETFNFILDKLKRFMPYIVIAFVICMPIRAYYLDWSISEILNSVWNLLLIRNLGIGKVYVMNHLWYIVTMLISMGILYPILRKFKENYIYIFSPIISILGLAYMFKLGTLGLTYDTWNGYVNIGLIRAFVELNIGLYIYIIVDKINKINYTRITKYIITIISQILLLGVLYGTSFTTNPKTYEFVMFLMIIVATTLMLTKHIQGNKFLNNKFIFYLEKQSTLIYINHLTMISVVKYLPIFDGYTPIRQTLSIVILSLVFSAVEEFILKIFIKKEINLKIKKIFIKD